MNLTYTVGPKELFHIELAKMGYYLGEGQMGEINEDSDNGTVFPVFRLKDGNRTDIKVAEIATFREESRANM